MANLDHQRAFELLPWLINGTLAGAERESVETHVRDCVTCRIALREQQRLRGAVRGQPIVPLASAHGFQELQRELERRAPARRSRLFGAAFAPRAALAAAALGAAAVTLLAWLAATGALDRSSADYTTLASAAPGSDAQVDLVFASWVTENDMRALLSDIDGTIVGGPSPAGRYTVRLGTPPRSAAETAALLERLSRDHRVRFAGPTLTESTQ